jgi:hypothetical protein
MNSSLITRLRTPRTNEDEPRTPEVVTPDNSDG